MVISKLSIIVDNFYDHEFLIELVHKRFSEYKNNIKIMSSEVGLYFFGIITICCILLGCVACFCPGSDGRRMGRCGDGDDSDTGNGDYEGCDTGDWGTGDGFSGCDG